MRSPPFMSDSKNPNNLRTGLMVAALALAFFVAIFVKRLWFS